MNSQEVYVISHYDADGVISAYLIKKLYNNAKVMFQHWLHFGLSKDDEIFNFLKQKNNAKIFITDLGSDEKTLDAASLLSKNNEVVFVDHHPPKSKAPTSFTSPNLHIIHSTTNCTTGLIYEYAEAMGFNIDDWFRMFTAVGIIADVADQTQDGSMVLAKIKEKIKFPFWERSYWSSKGGEFSLNIASSLGAMINSARRITYHYGATVAFKALQEIESGGLEFAIRIIPSGELEDLSEEAKYPHLALLKRWHEVWLEKRNEIFSSNRIVNMNFEKFYLSFLNHPWDIAGYVANVKAKPDKPAVAINYGVPSSDYASLAARGGDKLDVVMALLTEKSEGFISGGGHPQAVGGLVSRQLDVRTVINLLVEVFELVK